MTIERYFRDDWRESHHHLTSEGFEHANRLIGQLPRAYGKKRDSLMAELMEIGLYYGTRIAEREYALALEELAAMKPDDPHGDHEPVPQLTPPQLDQLHFALAEEALRVVLDMAADFRARQKTVTQWHDYGQRIQSAIKACRKRTVESMLAHGETEITNQDVGILIRGEEEYPYEGFDEAFNKACLHFSEQDRAVLAMRHGLDGYPEHSMEEIGEAMNVNTEAARRWVSKTVRNLQMAVNAQRFEPFLPLREQERLEEGREESRQRMGLLPSDLERYR